MNKEEREGARVEIRREGWIEESRKLYRGHGRER